MCPHSGDTDMVCDSCSEGPEFESCAEVCGVDMYTSGAYCFIIGFVMGKTVYGCVHLSKRERGCLPAPGFCICMSPICPYLLRKQTFVKLYSTSQLPVACCVQINAVIILSSDTHID